MFPKLSVAIFKIYFKTINNVLFKLLSNWREATKTLFKIKFVINHKRLIIILNLVEIFQEINFKENPGERNVYEI